MGQLRDRMDADLRLRGLSENTRRLYLRCARDFAAYCGRSPAVVGTEEVGRFCGTWWIPGARPPPVASTRRPCVSSTTSRSIARRSRAHPAAAHTRATADDPEHHRG